MVNEGRTCLPAPLSASSRTGRVICGLTEPRPACYDGERMKKCTLCLLPLAMFCATLSLPSAAAEPAPAAEAAQPAVSGKVGAALAALKPGVDTWNEVAPATDADFYIYLTSASWCGPCNAEMPQVVEAYRKMRESGRVELILISADRAQEAAVGFMDRYGASFALLPSSGKTQQLPGYVPCRSIPHAVILDKDGKQIINGHGSLVMDWEMHTINNGNLPEGGEAAEEEEEAAMLPSLSEAVKALVPQHGGVAPAADYYIYLQVDPENGPALSILGSMAKAYGEMQKDGLVELIVVNRGAKEKMDAWMEKSAAAFPVVSDADEALKQLPGYTRSAGVPHATIINKQGKVLKQGFASLLHSWKQHTIGSEK